MYYEFTSTNKDNSITITTVDPAEYRDQLSYYKQGIKDGWLLNYSIKAIKLLQPRVLSHKDSYPIKIAKGTYQIKIHKGQEMRFINKAEFVKAIIEAGENGLVTDNGETKVFYSERNQTSATPFRYSGPLEFQKDKPMEGIWDYYSDDWELNKPTIKKPMSTKKFLKLKNKLVKRVTGVTLVPKDQIVKTPRIELFASNYDALYANVCPYCQLYKMYNCYQCPMAEAGNECGNMDSSWRKVNQLWIDKATKLDQLELQELVEKYNKG